MAVYFIRAGNRGPVKIGWAKDVAARMATLQAGNHCALQVIRIIDAPRAAEKWLHHHFGMSLGRTMYPSEWFHFAPEMLTIALTPEGKIA